MSWRWIALSLIIGLELMVYVNWDLGKMGLIIESSLPKKSAAVVRGMVLGDGEGFSNQEKDDWRRAGLWHLAVASGSNLMWLNRWVVEGLAGILGRRGAIIAGGSSIWLYTSLLGWPIALVRAAVLMTIYYLAQWTGRRFDVWRAAGVGALLLIFAKPEVVNEAGFWLSMAAYIAVVGWENKEEKWWWQEIKTTMRVVWWTWPILLLIGGYLSILGPVISVLSVPVAPIILGGGMVVLVIAMIVPELAGIGWWAMSPLVEWLKVIVSVGARMGVVERVEINWAMLFGWGLITWWRIVRRHVNG